VALRIRPPGAGDFDDIWSIFRTVIATGDTYVFAADTPRDEALAYFLGPGITSFVAEDDGTVVGVYKLIPNRRDRGSHVANASFMVAPSSAGRGIGRQLGLHCLREAKRAGFVAMQFNFVVSTNARAVSLWESLGFQIVGTQPKVFRHATLGDVDAYVMYRSLDDVDPGGA
jgi:ribosomal protein S18 acetylase RimI-like enzyme